MSARAARTAVVLVSVLVLVLELVPTAAVAAKNIIVDASHWVPFSPVPGSACKVVSHKIVNS